MPDYPANWGKHKLADVLDVQNGYAFDSDQFSDTSGMPLIRIRDLKVGTRTEAYFDGAYDSSYLVGAGDYLIGMDGNFGCFRWQGPSALLNQRVCRLRNFSDQVDPEFIFFGINEHLTEIEANTNYATVKHLSSKQIKSIEMAFPPLNEQHRIVARIKACIERIDEIEGLRKEAALEAHALLPASLATVFRELEEQHPLARVGDVITESRYGTSQKCLAPDTATPVLRIPNVAQGEVNFEKLKYTELGAPELSRLAMQEGDVLVVRTNGSPDLVGRCAVFEGADQAFAYASYLIRLRPDRTKVDPRYLAFFLSSTLGRDAIEKIKRTSAGQYNINSENLRAIELPLPPLTEQQRIAQRLRDQQVVARTIANDQLSRVDEASLLRNAVLRKAFAGEL